MNAAESRNLSSASVDEFNQQAVKAWLDEHAPALRAEDVTIEQALVRLGLASQMGSRVVPTVAGLYLFGRRPQWSQPQLGVVAARFEGRSISDPVGVREHIEGPLPDLVARSLAFVESHARPLINQMAPEQSSLEFPPRALHEALVNALVHRDLRAGGQVAVRLFADRCEVWSPGSAAGVSGDLENYLGSGGVSLTRNPLVALVVRKMGLAEQMGRGLPTMRRVVRDQIHGEVTIADSKEGVLVTIPSGLHTHASVEFEKQN